jgi:hypothetical protein
MFDITQYVNADCERANSLIFIYNLAINFVTIKCGYLNGNIVGLSDSVLTFVPFWNEIDSAQFYFQMHKLIF